MALNKVILAALKALSYPEPNLEKNYKLERQVMNLTHKHYLKPFYQTWDHEIFVGNHCVPVRIFIPFQDRQIEDHASLNLPVLLFFHGGGWVTGNIDSYDKICHRMARITGQKVVSVDYRLAPEYKFPSAVEDCYAVAKEVFLHSERLGCTPDEITLIGDSAGGNLAAVVSLMARDKGDFQPKKQILLYPSTYWDHSENSPFPSIVENGTDFLLTSKKICEYIDLYVERMEDRKSPYFAPLMAEDFADQPDTLIITAEYDPLRDEGEYYGRRLKDAGNPVVIHRVNDALHGFLALPPSVPIVKELYEVVNTFLNGKGEPG